MTKLERILPTLYRDMHAQGAFHGEVWKHHLPVIREFFSESVRPVLDFGCGPRGGLAEEFGSGAISYDPYVRAYAASPWGRKPAGVFSCDVLEHMTLSQLRLFVRDICRTKTIQRVLLVLSNRAANKVMPNGMNAHITVRHPLWWSGFFEFGLGSEFTAIRATADLIRQDCVFAFVRNSEDRR